MINFFSSNITAFDQFQDTCFLSIKKDVKLTDTCNGYSLRDFQTWLQELYYGHRTYLGRKRVIDVGVRIMVFNATFNNTSVLSWRSVLLVATTWLPEENHRHAACHWQTLSHNVVLSGIRTHNVSVNSPVLRKCPESLSLEVIIGGRIHVSGAMLVVRCQQY